MTLAYGPAQAVMMLLALFRGGPAAEASGQATGVARDPTPSRGEYVSAASYSRDGGLLALAQPKARDGTGEPRILLFDTRTWKPLFTLTWPADTCSGVAFSADGARLFAACEDGLVYSWDTASGAAGRRLDAGAGPSSSPRTGRSWPRATSSPGGSRCGARSTSGTPRPERPSGPSRPTSWSRRAR